MSDVSAVPAAVGPPEGDVPSVYANVVAANASPWDVRLTFGFVTIPHAQPGSDVPEMLVLVPSKVADVVLPKPVIAELIRLLQRQLDGEPAE